jgi:exodeoxyribonuclease VII large subunit
VVTGLAVATARLDRASARLAMLDPSRSVAVAAGRLAGHRSRLEALSPKRVLERGYAVVRDRTGAVLRDTTGVAPGDALSVEVARGRLAVTVDGAEDGDRGG